MRHIKKLLAVAAVSSVLAACSSSQFQPPAVQQSNPGSTSYSNLQFVVGTANIAGTTGLNVVSTLRQPDGLTADLVNTPTLTGPFSLAALTTGSGNSGADAYATIYSNGPSATEKSKNAIMGTPQSVRQGTPACDTSSSCPSGVSPNTTTFGQFGGIERMGFFPGNSTPGGSPGSYVPYSDPIYATSATSAEAWVPWGGPPAYDDSGDHMGTRDGVHHSLGQGVLGVFDGMTVFQMAPVAGSYTLATVVPTGLNSSNQATYATITKSATLSSTATLPTITTAPTFTADANGDGGGTLTVTLPPGATEGMVTIEDVGPGGTAAAPSTTTNCQGSLGTSFAPVYYTIEFTASGTITLPAANGPNVGTGSTLTPSPSLCTAAENTTANSGTATPADSYVVQQFAMDYPLYEASEPSNKQQAPTIAGGSGQADITISPLSAATPY